MTRSFKRSAMSHFWQSFLAAGLISSELDYYCESFFRRSSHLARGLPLRPEMDLLGGIQSRKLERYLSDTPQRHGIAVSREGWYWFKRYPRSGCRLDCRKSVFYERISSRKLRRSVLAGWFYEKGSGEDDHRFSEGISR